MRIDLGVVASLDLARELPREVETFDLTAQMRAASPADPSEPAPSQLRFQAPPPGRDILVK
jgi:hypothetical protein